MLGRIIELEVGFSTKQRLPIDSLLEVGDRAAF